MKPGPAPGCPWPAGSSSSLRSLSVTSGFCSEPESANSLLDDRLVEDEPGVVVAGREDLLSVPERVEAREVRRGQSLAVGVEPDRRRPRDDADRVVGPDRVPVVDALDVVPHAVPVDEAGARALGDGQHAAVDVGGNARDHVLRRRAEPVTGQFVRTRSRLWPMPPVVTTTAAARSSNSPASRDDFHRAARRRRQHGPAYADDRAVLDDQVVDLVAVREGDLAAPSRRSTGSRKTRTTSGPVPQVRWKRGTELPCPSARPSPRSAQPTTGGRAARGRAGTALLAGGEVDVGLRPLPGPEVLALAVELRGAQPVLQRQLESP